MAQQTNLLSIHNVKVIQLSPLSSKTSSKITLSTSNHSSHSHSILFHSTTLHLKLLDIIPSSITSFSHPHPPPYSNLSSSLPPLKDPSQSPSTSIQTCLLISLADGCIEIPLSQSSHIISPSPRSYLIPILSADQFVHQDLESENSHLIKLEFPNDVSDQSLDTLNSILASWSHFSIETNLTIKQPSPSHPSSPYSSNHSTSTPSSAHQNGAPPSNSAFPSQGRLALMDESTGEICGELDSDVKLQIPSISQHAPPYPPGPSLVSSTSAAQPSTPQPLLAAPQPVMVTLSSSNSTSPHSTTAEVSPLPIEDRSKILDGAEWVSRGILAGSAVISALIAKSGHSYLSNSKPTTAPITFSPTTHSHVDQVVGFTRMASKASGKAATLVGNIVGKVGDSIGKASGIQRSPSGALPTGTRGYVHKGLLACNTVLNSLETGAKKVLTTAGDTTTNVVTHAYGAEAGNIAQRSNAAITNVALVYIDARGVTRRAILKSVGKAAIKGRMKDGREVILGSDEKVDDWVNISVGPSQSKTTIPSQPNKPE